MKFKTKSKEYETLLKEIKNTLWQELTLVKRRKRLTEELNELWNSEGMTEEYKNTRSCQLGYLLNDICTTTRSALPVAHRNRDSCLPQGLTQKF